MRLKIYERTGIKEERLLKDSQVKLIKKQESQQQLRVALKEDYIKKIVKIDII